MDRTLVLPPFEWYDGQAQLMANAFRATPEGRTPLFVRWSELFDLTTLRRRVPLVEWDDLLEASGEWHAERALYATGTSLGTRDKRLAEELEGPLRGVLAEKPCKPKASDGLLKNLTAVVGGSGAYAGSIFGGRLSVGALRCGPLILSEREATAAAKVAAPPRAETALREWAGDAAAVAIFSVGHYTHTKNEAWMALAGVGALHTPPAAPLEAEARRFVQEVLRVRGDASSPHFNAATDASRPFVALHWRHGDYVLYKLDTAVESMAKQVRQQLAAMGCAEREGTGVGEKGCKVFVMTNCRELMALAQLKMALPTATFYEPPDEGEMQRRFADEGPKLVIEQAIATLADRFVGTPRSAVTSFVQAARKLAVGGRAWQSDEPGRSPVAPAAPEAKAEL